MCGIAGQVAADGQASAAVVERMCQALIHRGPDSGGLHTEPGVALGSRRLAIIDVAHGEQPILNEDRSVAVVLNGEIYNYRELRAELQSQGHRFSTAADTEVLVHGYEEWGAELTRRLRGMFAFAIWDGRERGLLLARDRVGKKPIHYHEQSGCLSFASELDALLCDTSIDRRVNPQAIDAFLTYLYVPAPMSAIAGVRQLPPASTLWWKDGRSELDTYWSLDYSSKLQLSGSEAADAVREVVDDAVRVRLISERPLGAFLSGGVDSTAVVRSMAESMSTPVRTFSVGFHSRRFNELPHARRVAELFGTEHTEHMIELMPERLLPRLITHYGEPFGDSSALPSLAISEVAAEHVTVVLNGDGGDESFAGYNRYISNTLAERLNRVPVGIRRALARLASRTRTPLIPNSNLARVQRLAESLAIPSGLRYAARMTYCEPDSRKSLYTDEFKRVLGGWRAENLVADAWNASDAQHPVDRMLDVDVRTYLPGDLLVKMDIATMAHSLEARSPLLDHQLMEFAARLPVTEKVRGVRTKVALKESLRGVVPDDLLDRPKWGFSVPLPDWMSGKLGDLTDRVYREERTRTRGVIRPERVLQLLGEHRSRQADRSSELWLLLVLELWHRRFIDGLPESALF